MSTADWLRRPNRGIHLTIRDVDCENFDVEAMVEEFSRLKVTFFSFFAGGYVTTYPTDLDLQRKSPWLGERDLTGEIVECAHRHGIKAIPMVDLGVLPAHAYEAHPEWAARDADGKPRRQGEGLYASCPMGGYVTDYSREIVREIVERYSVDGMKFGGGSYGFSGAVCHCAACAEAYAQVTGRPLPDTDDWADPDYRRYVRWRTARTVECVGNLVSMVHSVRPDLPVVGNAVCFGDPGWTVSKSLDIERMAERQDAVQVEAQTRAWYEQSTGVAHWQYLKWPAETATYMTSVSQRPIWVVVSYFCAWPWRRNAVPPTEQKVYLAQIAAHGASPMVNLSGGPPAVHEDRRGFRAIEELYGFLDRHCELLEGTESAAEVAIVYDHDSLTHLGHTGHAADLVEEIRGFEEAFQRAHVPFDIISTRTLAPGMAARYRALVLPNLCCMNEETADHVREYADNGGGVVATHQTGLLDGDREVRDDFLLGDVLGVRYAGETCSVMGDCTLPAQGYMRPDGRHAMLQNLEGVKLTLIGGRFCRTTVRDGAAAVLRRAAPFRLFPEGWAYTTDPDPAEPMLVASEGGEGGRAAYFAPAIGRCFWQTRFPDLGVLLRQAVQWAGRTEPPLLVDGPPTLHTSLRRKGETRIVHCINLTGGERYFTELVPLRDVGLRVRMPDEGMPCGARRASDGKTLPVDRDGQYAAVTVPVIDDYDIIVFEPE